MLFARSYHPPAAWRGALGEMDRLRREMGRLLGSLPGEGQAVSAGLAPALNLVEKSDAYVVSAELPGVKPEDVEISVAGRTLTLAGRRAEPELDEKARHHRRERSLAAFSRVLALPAEVDPDKVEARAAAGILTITLPKAEKAKPRRIAVSAG
jgi:HSP20 family protein